MKHKYLLLQTDPKHRKSLYNNRVKQGTAGQSPDILKHLTKQNLTKALYYAAVLLIIAGAFYFASKVNKTSNTIKLNQLELKSTQYKLQELNSSYDAVLKEKSDTAAQKEAQDAKVKELEAEKARLESELQTKRATAVASIKAAPVYAAALPSGDWVAQCHAWAAQAGISLDASAIKLLERESKCSPTVCNPNGLACGIPQALPWTKMGCSLSAADAPCQLRWFQNYVLGRYGSYANALAHSYANGWY